MDNTTRWLIGGFCYLLGALGTFLIKFLEVRKTSWSNMQTFEEAAIAASSGRMSCSSWCSEVVSGAAEVLGPWLRY